MKKKSILLSFKIKKLTLVNMTSKEYNLRQKILNFTLSNKGCIECRNKTIF